MTEPTVRVIDDDDFATWTSILRTALLHLGPMRDEEELTAYREWMDLPRCIAAVDDTGRLCGTARAFATDLTLPGGATVPAAAISSVGVLPTHRRQGHLSRMMRHQLADIAERGEPVAYLIAAEYPIYGRYGYGPSNEACVVELDAHGNGGWRHAPTGTVELVDGDTLAPTLVELYDRARLRNAGHITWEKERWEIIAGARDWPDGKDEQRRSQRKVIWRDHGGCAQGAAIYSVDDNWVKNRPQSVLRGDLLVTATDEAHRELVRYLAAVDWVATVRLNLRPIDDPTPLYVHDGRAAALLDRSDQGWTRIVDVPAALSARSYASDGRVVIDVVDSFGFANGRFALEVDGSAASCQPTDEAADVVAPVSALSAAYLGGISWGRLQAGGWVDESRPGGVERASAMFTTARAPWCPMTF